MYKLINVTHWLCSQSPRKPRKCMFAHILEILVHQCHTDRVWKALHTAQSESLVCVCIIVNVGEDGDDAVSHWRMRREGQGCCSYLFLRKIKKNNKLKLMMVMIVMVMTMRLTMAMTRTMVTMLLVTGGWGERAKVVHICLNLPFQLLFHSPWSSFCANSQRKPQIRKQKYSQQSHLGGGTTCKCWLSAGMC